MKSGSTPDSAETAIGASEGSGVLHRQKRPARQKRSVRSGRRPGNPDTRQVILDAARATFAEVGWFGVTTQDGLKFRMVALFAAAWFAVFAIPVLLRVPEIKGQPASKRVGFFASYRVLFRDLGALYRHSPHTVYFLGASALFRDGLAAVFTFGAVLAVTVYGINSADVLIFGVAANVVSAIGALVAGRFDDKVGPKAVIVVSLSGMLLAAGILLFVSGPTMFWIFGLFLCLWVGPAQSSSRTFLARLAPIGGEGQLFGLYATTGRAVSFIAPVLFGFFTYVFGSDRAGIVGILLVLGAGLLALLPVKSPVLGATPEAVHHSYG